jgi:ABC-type transport system involved in cytochrome c biogenesis permease subunit
MKRPLLYLALCGALAGGAPAAAGPEPPASPAVDVAEFARLPVLDKGRKKPMDSLARQLLLQFSGRSSLPDRSAAAWLAAVVITPERTTDDLVFLINHPQVAEALGVEAQPHRRYSFAQLEPALPRLHELARAAAGIDEKRRSVVENELVRVYGNLNTYLGLTATFQYLDPRHGLPLDPEVRDHFELPAGRETISFLELFLKLDRVRPVMDRLQARPPEEWSVLERSLFNLSAALFEAARMNQNLPLEIIPVAAHGHETWLAPWDALSFVLQSETIRSQQTHLARMAEAYRDGRPLEFNLAARAFHQAVEAQLGGDRELRVIPLEILFNRLDLFHRSMILYGFGFMAAFAAMLSRRRWIYGLGLALVGGALVLHTGGVILRMIIMARPPVTNLYATFLFVGWVSVMLCLAAEYFQRSRLGLLGAGFSGLALLMIAGRFAVEGDPLGKVVAVLDSNFWLATHVVCITTGYAGCCVAGLIGHIYILQRWFQPGDAERARSTYRTLFAVLGFGLTFSFFGTMLGGVWADQSWGRFWGWDPKENGALLIVLWCAVLFHARLGRMIDDLGMAAGAVLGMIVVMFAWLGVNLLGVGLHSYGFTSGLFQGLILYTGLEVLFVCVMLPWVRARKVRYPPAP